MDFNFNYEEYLCMVSRKNDLELMEEWDGLQALLNSDCNNSLILDILNKLEEIMILQIIDRFRTLV